MDFDNLCKVAKIFLVFSIGLLNFLFSIKSVLEITYNQTKSYNESYKPNKITYNHI